MSTIGPELPPHLAAKRKREADSEQNDEKLEHQGTGRALRHSQKSPSTSPDIEATPESTAKRRRVLGPSLPPAALEDRPSHPPNDENEQDNSGGGGGDDGDDGDDDDDFGPSLPTALDDGSRVPNTLLEEDAQDRAAEQKTRRDEWMIVPPKQDDLAARMDPTKLRAKGFNTGKGAKGPSQGSGGPDSIWLETPEQKRKRLQDEVLGISSKVDDPKHGPEIDKQKRAEEEQKARKIRDYNEKHRSKSLYAEHQVGQKKEKEDDPSKRAFDHEKDMGSGMKIGHAKRREMLAKASDFGSRFSSGSFL